MRRTLLTFTTAVVLTLCAGLGTALAQTGPTCNGDLALVRVSEIKPTSSLAAFMKAQEAHIAWYRKNGFSDNMIYSVPVFVMDPATKSWKTSNQVMAFHVRPPSGANGASVSSKDQAGWDAYVKMYRDASDIRNEYTVCLPKNR